MIIIALKNHPILSYSLKKKPALSEPAIYYFLSKNYLLMKSGFTAYPALVVIRIR